MSEPRDEDLAGIPQPASAPRTLGEAMSVVTAQLTTSFGGSQQGDSLQADDDTPGQSEADSAETGPSPDNVTRAEDSAQTTAAEPAPTPFTAPDLEPAPAPTSVTTPDLESIPEPASVPTPDPEPVPAPTPASTSVPTPAPKPVYRQPSIDLWVVRPARPKVPTTAQAASHTPAPGNETGRSDHPQEANELSLDSGDSGQAPGRQTTLDTATAVESMDRDAANIDGVTGIDTAGSDTDPSALTGSNPSPTPAPDPSTAPGSTPGTDSSTHSNTYRDTPGADPSALTGSITGTDPNTPGADPSAHSNTHRDPSNTDPHTTPATTPGTVPGAHRDTPNTDPSAPSTTHTADQPDPSPDQSPADSTQPRASNPLARTARSIILSIDTSTRVCVGVAADGEALAAQSTGNSRSHVELLMPTVQSVLLEAGLTVRDLTGIVVGMGPGPYTGLRVGVAAAEILGMTLGIPVHHVCSLDVIGLSWATTHPIKNYIACTDARRKELYWAVYDTFGRRLDGPNVSAPTALPKQPIVGPGTLLYPTAGGGMDTFLALRLGVRVDQIADEWPSLEDVSGILGLDPGLMAAWGEQLPEVGPKPLYLRHADATTPGLPKSVLPVVLPPALRRATPADLPAIMELETTAFSSGWSQDSWAKEEGSHWVTVAVTPSGEVVGVIAMSVLLDTAELLRVIVAPGARQAGLGRRLVEQSLAWATEQGADQVFLEVSTNNDSAIRLYEKCDFHEISRREGYYGPGDDAVIYRWSPAETKEN